MTEESTPKQESAPEKAPNLDAVLEGAINQALPTEETPTPEEVKLLNLTLHKKWMKLIPKNLILIH